MLTPNRFAIATDTGSLADKAAKVRFWQEDCAGMHIRTWAATTPDKPALIVAETGEAISFAELDARSNRVAQHARSEGLRRGDGLAAMMTNGSRYFDIYWGTQRSGLSFTPVPDRLTAAEAAYIIEDCGAKMLVLSSDLAHLADDLRMALPDVSLWLDGENESLPTGFRDYAAALAQQPGTSVNDESIGSVMLYSSGTTGRPKGIRPPPREGAIDTPDELVMLGKALFGFDDRTIYLSPAPLYHAAPLRWSATAQALGGTVVIMRKFDPAAALGHIETYRITHSQWVPTHFVRMLKLPEDERQKHDLSSHRMALHAAAPCPVEVKRAMIDWWGPIIHEYYAGSEGFGATQIGPQDWLDRPGSVGRPMSGIIHICGDDGTELAAGETGVVFWEKAELAEYHNDPEKTAQSRHPKGWATFGDIGYVDEDGFLFLTDRKSFMIISGGVNVYPQEIEDVLIMHPDVADAAVIGAPDADLGERVTAVVQPASGEGSNALRDDLAAFLRQHLSGAKIPRQIDFRPELPRLPTGKLQKRLLVEEYRAAADN
ncbi:acyl-CoA synthetase [Alteripontixanthobacter maritimus]|nr:acyl-CoA synthetase [Alteripontixanthobacter maritimus]